MSNGIISGQRRRNCKLTRFLPRNVTTASPFASVRAVSLLA